jgi:ATP-binding cassette, subfamily B (MDR/TAP), member 1
MDASGEKPQQVEGRIELTRVRLVYPSRPEKFALREVDIVFPAGKTTAVIGASGCGKSSIIGLIERFYTPISGSICKK